MIHSLRNASMSVCLLSLIAGCASTQPSTVTIYEQTYIPDSILPGCPGVAWEGGTFGQLSELAEKRRTALKDCDDKFTAARKYQDDLRARAKAAAARPGGV